MIVQELQIPALRGAEIPATLVLPCGAGPFPLVALIHGFAGSRQEGGGYPLEAEALASAGIASIRMDFAGCGDSKDSFRNCTLSKMSSDVVCCMDFAMEHAPIDPSRLGLQGMSQGGRVTMELLNRKLLPVAAVALISPAAEIGPFIAFFGSEERMMEYYAKARTDGFCRYYDEMFHTWRDLDVTWFSEHLGTDTLGNAHPFDGPIQVVWAADDTLVPPSVSWKSARAYGASLVEISGAGHTYGCYNNRKDILQKLIDCQTAFFSKAFLG